MWDWHSAVNNTLTHHTHPHTHAHAQSADGAIIPHGITGCDGCGLHWLVNLPRLISPPHTHTHSHYFLLSASELLQSSLREAKPELGLRFVADFELFFPPAFAEENTRWPPGRPCCWASLSWCVWQLSLWRTSSQPVSSVLPFQSKMGWIIALCVFHWSEGLMGTWKGFTSFSVWNITLEFKW